MYTHADFRTNIRTDISCCETRRRNWSSYRSGAGKTIHIRRSASVVNGHHLMLRPVRVCNVVGHEKGGFESNLQGPYKERFYQIHNISPTLLAKGRAGEMTLPWTGQ